MSFYIEYWQSSLILLGRMIKLILSLHPERSKVICYQCRRFIMSCLRLIIGHLESDRVSINIETTHDKSIKIITYLAIFQANNK